MAVIKCYRIDYREFKSGDEITSPGDHIDRLPPDLKTAELAVRAVSAEHARIRSHSLYAFDDRDSAEKYFLGKQGALYEIEVEEANIRHSAQMRLVNDIAAADAGQVPDLVRRYWAGERGMDGYVEILTTTAIVSKKLFWTIQHKVELKKKHY